MFSIPAAVPSVKPIESVGVSVPFIFGAQDGANGDAFAPESYFVKRTDQIQYAFGYELARGVTEATRQFTASVNWR